MAIDPTDIEWMPATKRESLRAEAQGVLEALDKYSGVAATGDLPSPRGFLSKAIWRFAEPAVRRLADAEMNRLEKALQRQDRAAAQGTAVSAALDVFDAYGATHTEVGVSDPTGTTFSTLRAVAAHNEVVLAITGRRKDQAGAFCRVAKLQGNRVEQTGFKVELAEEEESPSTKDRKRIKEIEQFLLSCGSAEPPDDEKPRHFAPSFEQFIRSKLDDRLHIDWCADRFWYSEVDPNRLTAFFTYDAGRVRRTPGTVVRVDEDGRRTRVPYKRKRKNTDEDIVFVAVDMGQRGGQVIDEFTAREMACSYANGRTDVIANGYGYSELEQALNAATIFMSCRNYNSSRFRLDSLPRGILTLFGDYEKGALQQFKLRWREMFQGTGKRWGFPIFSSSTANAAANWISLDQSSREMEYHQFMFTVSLWMHALYKIHPEETGFEALSPFRPPLSEASPDAKLQYSQDSGFSPLMQWLEDYINREIMTRIDDTGRFVFRWKGLGQRGPLEDAQVAQAQLAAGQVCPREVLAAMDKKPAGWLRDCPAYDLHMPLPQGFQTMLQLYQAAMMIQQQQQAQAMQAQQQSTQRMGGDMQQMAQQMAGQQMGTPPQDAAQGMGDPMGGQPAQTQQQGGGEGGVTPWQTQEPADAQMPMTKALTSALLKRVTLRVKI